MKIAIVHEMLVKFGGAEQVVQNIWEIFPDATLYTLLYDEKHMSQHFPKDSLHPSCFNLPSQKIYNICKKQRWCLPWMARSVEQLDLSEYDVVLISSSGFAHGVITKPETKCIVYYHSPSRYLWDWTNESKKSLGFASGLRWYVFNSLLLKLRQWDYMASQRVDIRLANSNNVQNRIQKYYRKNAEILYPPVDTMRFYTDTPISGDYYIILSALTEFKNIDIAVQAFNEMPEKKLVIIWAGDYKNTLESMSSHSNISFVWAKYDQDLVQLIQESRGLIFPWEEDFGIVPIEVMAAGKPIFAYNGGWLTETVLAGITGEFFDSPAWDDFIEKFRAFDTKNIANTYNPEACVKQARKFDKSVFKDELIKFIWEK